MPYFAELPHQHIVPTDNDAYEKPVERATYDDLFQHPIAVELCESYTRAKTAIQQKNDPAEAVSSYLNEVNRPLPDTNHAQLARGLLGRLFEHAYKMHQEDGKTVAAFGTMALKVLAHQSEVPAFLAEAPPQRGNKRQPNFFETFCATIRRKEVIETLPDTFGNFADAIIIGGSMSYGPFYSVRDGMQNNDPSDIDAIVVLSDEYLDPLTWGELSRSRLFDAKDSRSLLSRLATFNTMFIADEVDVISQRFTMVDGSFNVSTHFMPASYIGNFIGKGLHDHLMSGENGILAVRDLKPRRFEHTHCPQQAFDGSIYRYTVPKQQETEDGNYIAQLPGYILHSGDFFPGLYQNLISPDFSVLSDNSLATTEAVRLFHETIKDRIAKERQAGRPAELSWSHIRTQFFAPGRYDKFQEYAMLGRS